MQLEGERGSNFCCCCSCVCLEPCSLNGVRETPLLGDLGSSQSPWVFCLGGSPLVSLALLRFPIIKNFKFARLKYHVMVLPSDVRPYIRHGKQYRVAMASVSCDQEHTVLHPYESFEVPLDVASLSQGESLQNAFSRYRRRKKVQHTNREGDHAITSHLERQTVWALAWVEISTAGCSRLQSLSGSMRCNFSIHFFPLA